MFLRLNLREHINHRKKEYIYRARVVTVGWRTISCVVVIHAHGYDSFASVNLNFARSCFSSPVAAVVTDIKCHIYA